MASAKVERKSQFYRPDSAPETGTLAEKPLKRLSSRGAPTTALKRGVNGT